MENPYSRAPLQATLYDVSARAPVRSYMFLGNVPHNVYEAARRGVPEARAGRVALAGQSGAKTRRSTSAWPETTWSEADAATLRRYYGSRWRWTLTPRVGSVVDPKMDEKTSLEEAVGGREAGIDFGSLADFDSADIIIEERDLNSVGLPETEMFTPLDRPEVRRTRAATKPDWDPQTVYVRETAYPEDTFADLKAKIYAATGVPPYRQHLFYEFGPGEREDDDEGGANDGAESVLLGWERPARTTYRVTVEGSLVLTDVRRFARELHPSTAAFGESDLVAGIPVDRWLEERKGDVRVDALDAFRTLEESPGVYVRRVFVADLDSLFRPREALVQKALADQYQFDLLYYGVVLKYWPSLSPEAFRLAVVDPSAVAVAFPLLDPPVEKVRARLELERALIDRIYSQAKAQSVRREREEKKGGLAVTEASITVEPRAAKTLVSVRNILDWVPATLYLPAIIARVSADSLNDAASFDVRKNLVVEKTHVSAASHVYVCALERFLARPPKQLGVSYAIVRKEDRSSRGRVSRAQPSFVYLTVFENGRYTIGSSWREDDRIGFSEVVEQLSAAARPVIDLINGMGAAAFPLGGALETPAEASRRISSRATIGSLTVSSFWPHALTSEGFRSMKTRWREYERAGLVGVRGLQQAGAYTFLFRKGITNYDPRALERVVSRADGVSPSVGRAWPGPHRQVVTNHYTYLTDPATAQRWQYVYAGRLVRIYHRTSDLRIEIVNVDMEEFKRIQLYAFVCLDSLLNGPDRLTSGLVLPGQKRPVEGRLRSLRERDPDLYDLKKFDEKAAVYSVLCQGDRQPEMFTEEEAKTLRREKKNTKAELVKFWNFTEGRPAYYRCPSQRFPHLSFRAGEHPLGYCLPCCKKVQAPAGTKAQIVNRTCLQKLSIAGEDVEALFGNDPTAPRHVLSYGKTVPVGRLSYAPRLLSDGLFYDTPLHLFEYRLVGVAQQTPSLSDAGFFFAVAATLDLGPEEFGRVLADTVLALQEAFRSLASGGATVFVSAEELADALIGAFVASGDALRRFSPFGPGGVAANSWRAIIADLVRIRFDVEIAIFADEVGDGDVVFEASAATAARLRAEADVDVALLVAQPSGTYPFMAMEKKESQRASGGCEPTRRFFSSTYAAEDTKSDRVVEVLRGMVEGATPRDCPSSLQTSFNMDAIAGVCRSAGHRILYCLINLRNMCYGLVIVPKWLSDGWVYFPVPYSPHSLQTRALTADEAPKLSALYGPRPEGVYPATALAKFLAEVNLSISDPRQVLRSQIRPRASLVAPDGSVVGFIANPVCSEGDGLPSVFGAGLFFHHDPAPASSGLPWASAPKASVPYAMAEIDRAIYEAGGREQHPPLPADKVALAERGLYLYHLYRLFVAEFAALLQDERNGEVRKELKALFKQTRFSSPKSLTDFRRKLAQVLGGFPNDIDAIRSLVASTYSRVGPLALYKALGETFDAMVFDFDRSTLNRLRALGDQASVETELSQLMRGRVELGAAASSEGKPAADAPFNVYVACSLPSEVDRPQCTRKRLQMLPEKFAPYVSILAADILNPLKAAILGTLTSGVIDGARFVARPGERISIR
ncbi:BA71V-G1340L [Elysia marginata]|uniref:BA71V-G1340L n=1 Tax=Elysia marginata TaxID=1093978 RepID=A0AAV4GR29_9GAST|nr:BA71V-G1340L [Elysia marginata]